MKSLLIVLLLCAGCVTTFTFTNRRELKKAIVLGQIENNVMLRQGKDTLFLETEKEFNIGDTVYTDGEYIYTEKEKREIEMRQFFEETIGR